MQAQKIVKLFCQERSISYHETGMVRSYVEILQHLNRVSVSLRRAKPQIPAASREV